MPAATLIKVIIDFHCTFIAGEFQHIFWDL